VSPAYRIQLSDPLLYPKQFIYVNPSGLDSNNGLSTSTAVKTIAKAMTLAPMNGKGTTIVLADGVYRETIRPPAPATMMQTGQLVFQSASKDNSKATIRCSNSITGTSFTPLTTLSASIQAPFAATARSKIYVADLGALGWTLPDLLRFRDDAVYEQRASGLNFLVQSSSASAAGASLDPAKRYHAARAPNFRNVTNWKRAEHWWVADGPSAGSTTSLVDATDDTGTLLAPADIEAGQLTLRVIEYIFRLIIVSMYLQRELAYHRSRPQRWISSCARRSELALDVVSPHQVA
jgi:hypothetical protein